MTLALCVRCALKLTSPPSMPHQPDWWQVFHGLSLLLMPTATFGKIIHTMVLPSKQDHHPVTPLADLESLK